MKNESTDKHIAREQRKKDLVDQRIANANIDRGIIVVNTGVGKGKSSSAFGMVARALGHGMRVGVVQFIKGAMSTGEELFFRDQLLVEFHAMGDGFTWETQNRDKDIASAERAWEQSKIFLSDARYNVVVLDELNIVLKMQYLDTQKVIDGLLARPVNQHVIVTGRSAPQALIDVADTVTDMKEVKHAFNNGIKAQKGIEL